MSTPTPGSPTPGSPAPPDNLENNDTVPSAETLASHADAAEAEQHNDTTPQAPARLHQHDPNAAYPQVECSTSEGQIIFELWPDVAPNHVEHFQQLVHEGFYDSLTFHRVIPDYIIQGGCPTGDGTGGPGWQIDPEFNDCPHQPGTLSMARIQNDPHSAGSQFFISLSREHCAPLDGQYTLFGRVLYGMPTVEAIAKTPVAEPLELGLPIDPPQIIQMCEVDGFSEEDMHDATHLPPESPDEFADELTDKTSNEPTDPTDTSTTSI